MEWQPIETAPKDGLHVRGLWVHCGYTGESLYWRADCGLVSDDGDFVCVSGDDFGWCASDYSHWMPLPEPPSP